MRYLESPSHDAFFNMALEEYLFETLSGGEPALMFWQNRNAVVVGRHQNTFAEVNGEYAVRHGVQVVRRLSGGGAMYQDLGNLNFTFVAGASGAGGIDFGRFVGPVVTALRRLGVPAEATGRNDIEVAGAKVSGNAQYQKQGRTMHHGTLLFSSDLDRVGSVLTPRADKIAARGVPSHRARVANIAGHLAQGMEMAAFRDAMKAELLRGEAAGVLTLSERDMRAVERLAGRRYATRAWNWGTSPRADIHRSRRYPFGGVELYLRVQGDVVERVRIAGDFFGAGELTELEQKLAGTALEPRALRAALAGVAVEDYIHGMTAEALAGLLLFG